EVAELFRLIRTNLQFAVPAGCDNKVMLVTSSMTGEGKTFFSINMGASLAITGKKVIVLEFDIRKPKLLKDLGVKGNKAGITNYLIDTSIEFNDLIHPFKALKGLYVMGAGPMPQNPSELLMSAHIATLMHTLKEEFDYILVD